jgi:hypothetical protein
LHPDVGVLVVENKGVSLADIHGVENTCLRLIRDKRFKQEDPFHQASRVMFQLRDLTASRADLSEALFLHTAALPRIPRSEFEQGMGVRWPDETLFAEQCSDPKAFRDHVLRFSQFTQRKAKRTSKLSKRAHDAVMTVLNGEGFPFAERKTYINETDTSLIGVQVQEMELAMREATHQQKQLCKADLRGNHRLFRGVAGSGKSIMLALSVAHTMTQYREEGTGLFEQQASKRRVLVVCFNKTLVHYLRQRIDLCFGRLAWDRPDDESLMVTHFESLVRQVEARAPSLRTGLDFKKKQERAQRMVEGWESLDDKTRHTLTYDAVYVDEAQDLLPEEFALLLKLAVKDEETGGQTLVLFYDNAQNVYSSPTPVWSKLGVNIVGRTEFLDTCLRNTKETLLFAFNVLVGSFAPEGQRVATRKFADVESLRQRKLIEERDGQFDIYFAPRSGPLPFVRAYDDRDSEINGVVEAIRRLVEHHRVLPQDILILFNSHKGLGDDFGQKLERLAKGRWRVRFVDTAHEANKNFPLIEDGVMTASTIKSAKGYDAAIVLLVGMDQLGTDPEDRAIFYVGATRAKLHLVVTGIRKSEPSLLNEIVVAATKLAGRASPSTSVVVPSTATRTDVQPPKGKVISEAVVSQKRCAHCDSARLHAQHGFNYYFVCIDCTKNTPMDFTCSKCGAKAKVRKAGNRFFRECVECKHSELCHENVPLGSIFE